MPNLRDILLFTGGFSVTALASQQIGNYFVRFRLPLISGFLATGILAGPYALNLITAEAVESLRFVDEIALAFIAFAAGRANSTWKSCAAI
jgi:Kef-type K+ transport system membrane component KefB